MLFISHSNKDKSIVESFVTLLSDVLPSINVRVSSDASGPRLGENWNSWIAKKAKKCEAAIILLTPNSINSPWVIYEAGLVAGVSDNKVLPVLVGLSEGALPGPLKVIETKNIGKKEDLVAVLGALVNIFIKDDVDKIKKAYRKIDDKDLIAGYIKSLEDYLVTPKYILSKKIHDLKYELGIEDEENESSNLVMMDVYSYFMERMRANIKDCATSPLYVPANEYPHYLIEVQSNTISVRAIAIVDDVEKFWSEGIGKNILNVSGKSNTRRVFVYKNVQHLKREIKTLLEHSEHSENYKVKAIGDNELRMISGSYTYDFSIFEKDGHDGGKVVARYEDDSHYLKCIMFTDDKSEIETHEYEFEKIWNRSSAVPHADELSSEHELNEFVDNVFNKRTEMSKYIDIEDYDKYELLHPHFMEMMDEILEQYKQRRSESGYSKILEMGAGTGHLTKVISDANKEDNNHYGQLLALEYDNKCCRKFRTKFREEVKVKCLNEDSATFDPPGKFDFIFSSFADHHIASSEKISGCYLNNIKRNLHAGSFFIVGDEFLPEHDNNCSDDRVNAINAYHDYIIGLAEEKYAVADESEKPNWRGMINLEEEARKSGLSKNGGDFKVSLMTYLQRLDKAGLAYDQPICIGPENEYDRKKVGGVYVICVYLPT